MENISAMLNVTVSEGSPPAVRLTGEADFHNRHQISHTFEALLGDGQSTILADLSGLHHIDSSALSVLILCATRASEAGGGIELTGVSERVSRMLTLCGAAAFFDSSVPDVPVGRTQEPSAPARNYWHVSDFSIPASPLAATTARSRVADVIRSLPLSLSDGHDVMVAVGEALANAIKHGCGCDPESRISIKCVAGPSRLAIDIADPGDGFNPEEVPPPSPDALMEGGMGIHLMRELMDEVSFSFDHYCTTVRLVKHVSSPTESEAPAVGELTKV